MLKKIFRRGCLRRFCIHLGEIAIAVLIPVVIIAGGELAEFISRIIIGA